MYANMRKPPRFTLTVLLKIECNHCQSHSLVCSFIFLIILYVCGCSASIYVCVPRACLLPGRVPKRATEPLEVE